MIINGKPCVVFDVEVLKNVFTNTVLDTETGVLRTFEISQRKNEIQEMCQYFTQPKYFVGYNNIHYDNPIMNYIIKYHKTLKDLPMVRWTQSIWQLGQIIMDNNGDPKIWEEYKYADYFLSIDLMTLLFSTQLRTGLKSMQATMHYPNLEEFLVDWNKELPPDQIDMLSSYNENDVRSTAQLLSLCEERLRIRENIIKRFNIECLSKDDVNLGMEILKNRYLNATGKKWYEIKDLRSPADTVDLEEIIFPWIKFKDPKLQALLTEMKSQHRVRPGRKGYEHTFLYGGMKVTIGVGGIHGDCGTGIIQPKANEILADSDVASLYPSMIIEHGLYPPHLGMEFLDVYTDIRTERLNYKKLKMKLDDITFKYCLNGLSGNLQQEFSWVYSPKTVMQIRINGQLLLLMLTERLLEAGCKLKQINTDGILYILNKDIKTTCEQICKDWETQTKLVLETEYFTSFYQLSVNDYFCTTPDLDVKKKGFFLTTTALGKGLSPKIIPEAIIKYFIDGTPVKDTIESCTDIRKFLQAEKTGKQWTVEYNDQEQQHVNRFYVSNNGLYLWKWKLDDRKTVKVKGVSVDNPEYGKRQYQNMLAGYGVTILNKLDLTIPINDLNINYVYYIYKCNKVIEQLKPRQLELFN